MLVLAGTLVAACSCAPEGGPRTNGSPRSTQSATPSESLAEAPEAQQIAITIGGQRLTATLDDSAAATDLLAQLPQTISMRDHGGVEKTGRLTSELSLDGQPDGADPEVGALGYYAPGQDLVLYYGDQSYFPGIVVLGTLDGDAASRIANMVGDVSVEVSSTS